MAAGDTFTFDGSGLTQNQILAAAATMACKPCGCGDSGSGDGGSGSGGGPTPETSCCGWCLRDTPFNYTAPSTINATITTCVGTASVVLTRVTNCSTGTLRWEYTSSTLISGSCDLEIWVNQPSLRIALQCDHTALGSGDWSFSYTHLSATKYVSFSWLAGYAPFIIPITFANGLVTLNGSCSPFDLLFTGVVTNSATSDQPRSLCSTGCSGTDTLEFTA